MLGECGTDNKVLKQRIIRQHTSRRLLSKHKMPTQTYRGFNVTGLFGFSKNWLLVNSKKLEEMLTTAGQQLGLVCFASFTFDLTPLQPISDYWVI